MAEVKDLIEDFTKSMKYEIQQLKIQLQNLLEVDLQKTPRQQRDSFEQQQFQKPTARKKFKNQRKIRANCFYEEGAKHRERENVDGRILTKHLKEQEKDTLSRKMKEVNVRISQIEKDWKK